MTPKIAKRGHSFLGASAYYLNNKKDQANERSRVEWTHTYNHSTDDPQKALNRMAYTAMRADKLKHQAGVSKKGRKATAGAVYTFSLSYHEEQNPTEQDMKNDAFSALEFLGLKDHQAVMVAHNDTDHPHVHVICNLVNPVNGRTKQMSLDRNKFSEWAEEHERKHGKIYCPERVKNNEKRRQLKLENEGHAKSDTERKSGFVKHREKKIDKGQIQNLYQQSDSAKAFQAALKDAGYELAKGDRRGLVLVDNTGKVHSLSRQMKGLWKKDKSTGEWKGGLQERFDDFKDLEINSVEMVKSNLAKDENTQAPEFIDKEQDNIERIKKELDAQDEHGKTQAKSPQKKQTRKTQKSLQSELDLSEGNKKDKPKKSKSKSPSVANDKGDPKRVEKDIYAEAEYKSFADEFDDKIGFDRTINEMRRTFQKSLDDDKDYQELLKNIEDLKKLIAKTDTIIGRTLGSHKQHLKDLADKQKTLDNANWRREEQHQANEKKIEAMIAGREAERKRQFELEQKARLEAYKKDRKQSPPKPDNDNQTPDKDRRYDLER